eukprot:scaffold171318_cov20-Tisochrysis_lutea.AAC.2
MEVLGSPCKLLVANQLPRTLHWSAEGRWRGRCVHSCCLLLLYCASLFNFFYLFLMAAQMLLVQPISFVFALGTAKRMCKLLARLALLP